MGALFVVRPLFLPFSAYGRHRKTDSFLFQMNLLCEGTTGLGFFLWAIVGPIQIHRRCASAWYSICLLTTRNPQFFVTVAPGPHCDGKNVVFGEVASGFDVVKQIETHASATDILRHPEARIIISDSGVLT